MSLHDYWLSLKHPTDAKSKIEMKVKRSMDAGKNQCKISIYEKKEVLNELIEWLQNAHGLKSEIFMYTPTQSRGERDTPPQPGGLLVYWYDVEIKEEKKEKEEKKYPNSQYRSKHFVWFQY